MNYVLGIDPGKDGGYALGTKRNGPLLYGKMPLTGGEVNVGELVNLLCQNNLYPTRSEIQLTVVIERVHSMPRQGVKSMFSFGTSFGKLIGMCQSLGLRHDFVLPKAWQKEILAGTKKDKEAGIRFVNQMYPKVNLILPKCRTPHVGISDAICIMEWGLIRYG